MESGAKLGHYEIGTLLGKGGMGEVWRARDSKLGREVAIKTLPDEFAKELEPMNLRLRVANWPPETIVRGKGSAGGRWIYSHEPEDRKLNPAERKAP